MGRHRIHASNSMKHNGAVDAKTERKIEERLGMGNLVCSECNARNPKNGQKCRRCGCKSLREKARDFRGKASDRS